MSTFTTADGVGLHIDDLGEGRPLVFLTGWAMSSGWWVRQREHVPSTRRAIIVDPRAQGGSDLVESGHRLARHAADLREVVVGLGLHDPLFVAWSRGSSVMMSYFEQFGTADTAGVVLCGFLPSLGVRADWPWGFNRPPQEFIDSVRTDYPGVVTNMILDMTHQKLPREFTDRMTEESLRTPPVAAARMLEDHFNVDWRDLLPRLDLPVLICAGEQDPQAPVGAAEACRALLPDGRVETFPESGHCVFIEEPERFNRVLDAFVREVDTA